MWSGGCGWWTEVKTAIESSAEDQYDISVATHQKADVDSFTKNLRAEQVQVVLSKGETIIMCSEFADHPAALKCEDPKSGNTLQIFEDLCRKCFVDLRSVSTL